MPNYANSAERRPLATLDSNTMMQDQMNYSNDDSLNKVVDRPFSEGGIADRLRGLTRDLGRENFRDLLALERKVSSQVEAFAPSLTRSLTYDGERYKVPCTLPPVVGEDGMTATMPTASPDSSDRGLRCTVPSDSRRAQIDHLDELNACVELFSTGAAQRMAAQSALTALASAQARHSVLRDTMECIIDETVFARRMREAEALDLRDSVSQLKAAAAALRDAIEVLSSEDLM